MLQNYTSVFTPPYDTRHRYKPLFQPGSDSMTPESDLTPSPNSASSTPVYSQLRRNTSNLTTIAEENHDLETGAEAGGRGGGGGGGEDSDRRPILS